MWAPDGLMAVVSPPDEPRKGPRRAGGRATGDRLAISVLAHLPLAVAVIGADSRLIFWNEQAACLFGAPPLMAEANPGLADILAGIRGLTPPQIDRIVGFADTHIATGDRAEPDSCLRLSLGRDCRITLQVYGLGGGRWMLVLDEGRMQAAAVQSGPRAGDAQRDALTGLANRRHFHQALLASGSAQADHAVLLIDLDRFGEVNEGFGRPVGDALLCLVAQRLRRELRDDDQLARLDGDAFAILVGNGDAAQALAARIVDIAARPFLVEGHLVTIGVSIGIARASPGGDDLLRDAELALCQVKATGGGMWRLFETGPRTRAERKVSVPG